MPAPDGLRGRALPVAPVLILFIAVVAANLAVMAIILVPPMVGRIEPAGARRRARRRRRAPRSRGRDRRRHRGVGRRRRRLHPDLRPRRPDRGLGLPAGDDASSSRRPGCGRRPSPRSSSCSRFAGAVRRRRPRPAAAATRSGPAKFVVEGSVAITVATLLVALTGGAASPFFFAFPLIVGGAALVVSPIDHGRAGRGGRASATSWRSLAGSPPGRSGRRPWPRVGVNLTALILLAVRRDGHRPGAAPGARRGHPPVDGRLADRPLQPDLLLRRDRARDRPQRAVGPRLLPADDGPRRAQVDQRPARPLPRRPGPARRRRGHHPRRPPDRHRRPLRRRRVRRRSCPRPTRPAPSSWPRRSGSASDSMAVDLPPGSPRPSLSIGVVATRTTAGPRTS